MEKPRARGNPLRGLSEEGCLLLRAVSGQCGSPKRVGRVGCVTPGSGRGRGCVFASVATKGERGRGAEEEWSRRRRRCGRTVKSALPAVVMAVGVLAARFPGGEAASAGLAHTCAVLSNNTVKCWGSNAEGQLGLNTDDTYGDEAQDMGDNLPNVPLGDSFVVEAVAAGYQHSCAINDWGGLKCWGLNNYGQLGLGDNETRGDNDSVNDMGNNLLYVNVGSSETVQSVVLGVDHTCAILGSGKLKCWGNNDYGQLGLGDIKTRGTSHSDMGDSLHEVDVGTNRTVSGIALGRRHTCALLDEGGVKCWGSNEGGQLGYEDTKTRGISPSDMGDALDEVYLGRDQRALAIAAGWYYSCALLNTGMVKCWGWNVDGQLGQGHVRTIGNEPETMGDFLPPIELGTNRTATAVSCGAGHTCAVLDDATVKCWGAADRGQLGSGNSTSVGGDPSDMGDNLLPVNLTFGWGYGKVLNVFGGTLHTCVSGTLSGLACFGFNNRGQLGIGSTENMGDEPGETQTLESIYLGRTLTVSAPLPDAGDFDIETISPTPAPVVTPAPSSPPPTRLSTPEATRSPAPQPSLMPSQPGEQDPSMPVGGTTTADDPTGDGSDEDPVAWTALIVAAAIAVPLLFGAVIWCYMRRKRQHGGLKASRGRGPGPTVGEANLGGSHELNSQGSVASSELHVEANGDGTPESVALKPLVKPFAPTSNTPVSDVDPSSGDLEAPAPCSTTTVAMASASPGRDLSAATIAVGALPSSTDDDESEAPATWPPLAPSSPQSSSHASDAENPGELRRRGMSRSSSGSSLSTLASTSTTSTAWTNDPFNTPARTDIPRGSGGLRYGGGRRSGHAVVGSGGSEDSESRRMRAVAMAGMATPASLAAATPGRLVPDTPSPRSTISAAGTPHPPEMRLAHFARAIQSENYLYGVPEMESGRSLGTTLDSGRDDGMDASWRGGRVHHREGSVSGVSASSASTSVTAGGDEAIAMASAASSGVGAAAATLGAAVGAGVGAASASGGTPRGSGGGAAAGNGASGTSSSSSSSPPPAEPRGTGGASSSPTLLGTTTPDRRRNESGSSGGPGGVVIGAGGVVFGAGGANEVSSRRKSGTRSNRSSRTSGTGMSPPPVDMAERKVNGGEGGADGMWDAQSFAVEADLEALQIDKNDLKLVFGRPFARGKTSEVYQVTHEGKNRAAKIIDLFLQGVVGNEVTRLYSCFAQELRTLKGIRHSCVSAVYGAVITPSELTIVTDLVKRGPLRTVLDDKKKESLTADRRHKILKDVARGMAYLTDQGVQHRNLHSYNVLITNSWGAKVADYGLSRTMEVLMCADGSGNAGSSNGGGKRKASSWRSATLRWTAPELIAPPTDGCDPYTTASDVYSMGVIAWETLCGGPKLPYDGVSNEKVKSMILEGSTPSIPMETPIVYAKLILQCWRKNPTLRPTFAHIAEVLLNDPPPNVT